MDNGVPGRGNRSPEALRPDSVACEEQQGGRNGLGQRVGDEFREMAAPSCGAGGGGQARAMTEAAVAMKAGGAVILSGWYFLVLVCARHGDTVVRRQMLSVYWERRTKPNVSVREM